MGAKKSQGSSPVLHEKRSKDSTKSKPVLRVRKSPVFARKIAKNLGKHIVFRGFCRGQHFYPLNMVYVTGLGLTILTNLLFIMIPQGYLPCAKLLMSLFMIILLWSLPSLRLVTSTSSIPQEDLSCILKILIPPL